MAGKPNNDPLGSYFRWGNNNNNNNDEKYNKDSKSYNRNSNNNDNNKRFCKDNSDRSYD